MRNSGFVVVSLWLCVWFTAAAGAITFEYTDGTKIDGEIVQGKAEFLQIRVDGNKYEKVEWAKLSQATLQQLAGDAKLKPFVEAYLEVPEDAIIKKTHVDVKPVPRLERPAKGSLLGAFFGSSVGLVVLLLLYAANIYAAYEVSVIRAYPAGLVCGLSAILPVIGPIIFLLMPTKLKSSTSEEAEAAPEADGAGTPAHSASYSDAAEAGAVPEGEAAAAAPALPQTQVFKRGQFTFNRRFIETKFSPFFGAVLRGTDKDLLLVVKSSRGEFVATRVTRISANDLHLDVHKGGASHEVQIPFLEIQEMQIKHKDS